MTEDLQIIKFGDPRLIQISEPVKTHEFGSAALKKLGHDLMTLLKENQAVGIAAPQVGINKRILAVGCPPSPRRPIPTPFEDQVILNPVITPLSDEMEQGYEGCLSSDMIMVKVPRHTKVRCQGYNLDGNTIDFEAENLLARVLQHELDHLDGVLFFERVTEMKSLGFRDELVKFERL